MVDVLQKIRAFGVRGIISFFRIKVRSSILKAWIKANAIYHDVPTESGVTVVAEFGASNSLNKTMRDLVVRLKRAGIPYQTLDVTAGKRLNNDIDDLLTPRGEFRARRYSLVIEMMKGVFPKLPEIRLARVVFWEAKDGLVKAFPFVADGRLAIGMSDFNVETLRRELESGNVRKLLYPFVFDALGRPSSEVREKYKIPKDAFMVYFNFDYTAFARKNPVAAVRAFAKAFSCGENAVLVFKTVKGGAFPERRKCLLSEVGALGLTDRFIEIDGYIPLDDIYGLTSVCDAYISLHRGEGFGLGIAEAMSLAKPVVVTDYSSTTEFCKADNACLVPFRMVKPTRLERGQIPYSWAIEEWADPDVGVASRYLLELYRNRSHRERMGDISRSFMNTYFSDKEFEKSVAGLLSYKREQDSHTAGKLKVCAFGGVAVCPSLM